MMGLFPSNFVEVLPDDFRPVSRSTSPLPPQGNTPSPQNTPQKSKTFRKPFEAYAKAPHYAAARQAESSRPAPAPVPSPTRPRETSTHSVGGHSVHDGIGRVPSPPLVNGYGSRAPSPSPSFNHRQYQAYKPPPLQSGSGGELQGGEPLDSPPPVPPPHRHAVSRHGSNASYDNRAPGASGLAAGLERHGSHASNVSHVSHASHASYASYDSRVNGPPGLERHGSNLSYQQHQHGPAGYHTPRGPSPVPPSPGGSGLTPSPLREAMDGVIEQLDALGIPRDTESPEPVLDPWSPESFDMVQHRSRKKNRREAPRPQTSMGLAQQVDEGYETYSGSGNSSRDPGYAPGYREDKEQLPQLSSYVERMETRLRNMHKHNASVSTTGIMDDDEPPPPPPKGGIYERPKSSMDGPVHMDRKLRHKRSAYEVGRQMLGRTFTTKTNSTNASTGTRSTTTDSSSNTQSTDRSLMSGVSAGGISATSAGSLARKNQSRAQSALGVRDLDTDRPETPFTGVTYHSSHASGESRSKSQTGFRDEFGGLGGLGGLTQPKAKKQGFFKKMIETAKTGVANSRGSIAAGAGSAQSSPVARSMGNSISSIAGGMGLVAPARDAAKEMGLTAGIDWVQVRRDVNRSNSLSRIERNERRDRCQMLDFPALDPVDELYDTIDGDEGADGMPVAEPTNYQAINLGQVDKNSRFISSLPPMTTAITLATTYVCRPFRSDVQRLRAIFTWVAEKITWEDEFEGQIDTRRVIQTKRGCTKEFAVLTTEMCTAVGLHCELVRGYLKTPGEIVETGIMPRPNHWWNAVLVDNEWRTVDCCLASPSNPRRPLYSSAAGSTADFWWFLGRPTETCYTHIPEHHAQQHMCPPVAHEILLNLPCACPAYFRSGLQLFDYNTSLTRIEDLEMMHVKFSVPEDVEVAAEVEVRAFSRDSDGDCFESGDVVKKRALAQAEWFGGVKRYTVKALLPGDEGTGVLKVYAGTRGLMHSIKDIPHPLAFALPIIHTGENPPYEFVTRHPTPHAQRHDIYVVQPQCQRLALNNTFVFAIRQHPSTTGAAAGAGASGHGATSPAPFARPGSAMSMTSSAAGSNPSTTNTSAYVSGKKPAKLAIQTPGGKILRLMRKEDRKGIGVGGRPAAAADEEQSDGGTWETIIKCSERGVWRGLVLADRTARWCVFAEWVCCG